MSVQAWPSYVFEKENKLWRNFIKDTTGVTNLFLEDLALTCP